MKKSKPYTGKIPFSLDGQSQLHYPADNYISIDVWDDKTKIGELTQKYIDSQKYYSEPPKPFRIDLSSSECEFTVYPCHYDKDLITVNGLRWRDNYIFSDYLRFLGFMRGRSAAYATLLGDKTNLKYTMFLTDVEYIIQNRDISHGIIFGNFTFCKRGANYGLKAVD